MKRNVGIWNVSCVTISDDVSSNCSSIQCKCH